MKTLFTLLLITFSFHSFSQNYDIYVSDAGNFNNGPWQILKFDSSGNNATSFIDTLLNWPQDILFIEDSNFVLISNLGSNNIGRYDSETGAFLSDFTTEISGPTRMKIGSDNLLYVLQWSGNGKVKRFEMDGSFVDDFTDVGVSQSIGLDWDADSNLYVSSYNGDEVRKFNSDGEDQGLFVDSDLLGPTNIWFDEEGDLLVSDYNGTAVKRFDSEGNYVNDFMTGLLYSEGVQYLPNGDILIGNGSTSSVKRYSSNGEYLNEFVGTGAGDLLTPNAVVLRFNSTVGIAENQEIEKRIVYPTIGTRFKVYTNNIPGIERITINSINGEEIISEKAFSSFLWDAESVSEGVYIVCAFLKDGTIIRQKIIVNK